MTVSETSPVPPAPPRAPGTVRTFFASRGWRFAMIIALTVLMCIPLVMVALVIEDRVSYQNQAVWEVSQTWGGPMHLAGPMIVIPVEQEKTQVIKDGSGESRTETYTVRAEPIVLLPEFLTINADSKSEIRSRGIFEVPVYSSDLDLKMAFDTGRIADKIRARERILWDKATLALVMPRTRSFSGQAQLAIGGRKLDLEPGTPFENQGGIQAKLGDPRGIAEVSLTMGLNGAGKMTFAPVGRQTQVTLTSDWPHPSFDGTFLPKNREVSAEGFKATWEIPHLARDLPQVSRGAWRGTSDFGVRFYTPNDFYQKVERAAKYGILFIALTFLTVFLTERLSARAAHPAQLILIGIAQCIFFLLLLSFSEQIGFTSAYLAASGATIGLIGLYGRSALGLARHTWILTGSLVALYGTLYLILRSTDYALLAGSILAFVAVALAMVMTRGDDWSASGRDAVPA